MSNKPGNAVEEFLSSAFIRVVLGYILLDWIGRRLIRSLGAWLYGPVDHLSVWLFGAGHRYVYAGYPRLPEALALVIEQCPDLIVSDIGMPGKDGLEFIQEVRALPGAVGRTPAIALTAFARPEDREMALRSGFQRHLGKPIDALAVAAACADLLADRALLHKESAAA